jgi:hypothetical protein
MTGTTAWWRTSAVLVAAAIVGCSGGEGERCNSGGILGPLTCDGNLLCNSAVSPATCENPMSLGQGQRCDSSALCKTGLWCNELQMACVPWLTEGEQCNDPESCAPPLICAHDLVTRMGATCQALSDGGLPADAAGMDAGDGGSDARPDGADARGGG